MKITLCFWCTMLLTIVLVKSEEVKSESELQNDSNCKALCQHCGCMGFYCGEECICECNGDNKEDMSCLRTMQSNCKKMNIPFELLIQGPTDNRFVRNALLLDQTEHQGSDPDTRSKRSTAVIYKPGPAYPLLNALANIRRAKLAERNAQQINAVTTPKPEEKKTLKSLKRRGIPSWLEENTNAVVPAPKKPTGPPPEILAAGSENMPRILPLPRLNFPHLQQPANDYMDSENERSLFPGLNLPGLPKLQHFELMGNAVHKMREALLNLNAKTEQLLSAAQTPPVQPIAHNLLGLLSPVPAPMEHQLPETPAFLGDDRPLFKSLMNSFPRFNNLLNN